MRRDEMKVESFVMSNQTPAVILGYSVTRGDVVKPASFGADSFLDSSLGGIVLTKGNAVEVVPLSSLLVYRLVNPLPAREADWGPSLLDGAAAVAATVAGARPKGSKPKLPEVEP